MPDTILIFDFGSQYTQLIARRIREHHVFCEIVPHDLSLDDVRRCRPKGLILSGGPASVYQRHVPLPNARLFQLNVPVLGVCYGMQAMAKLLGGEVVRTGTREYGTAPLMIDHPDALFQGLRKRFTSWMSHGDSVTKLPPGFRVLAHTTTTPTAAMADLKRRLYGLQFHPEVTHTQHGTRILANFLFKVCACRPRWTMRSFIELKTQDIRRRVGKARVILGLSGGVDSSVTAVLVHRAIGPQLTCLFVDNGLLRRGEAAQVRQMFGDHCHLNLQMIDARQRFLGRLHGITDPEQKRKIIGESFIRVFEEQARTMPRVRFLAQGTLYPDVIESRSPFGGPSAMIKTHHNVGGLPKDMPFELIEPLKELFKDEVREVGRELGLPSEILSRHPFPGPGLAVRILGAVTEERLEIVRAADAIAIEELTQARAYDQVWQAFTVLLPVKSVGLMGDERTYEHVIVFRAVTSTDGMTADWAKLPPALLGRIANRIINEVQGVNRVVYDISSKPPATIEWE